MLPTIENPRCVQQVLRPIAPFKVLNAVVCLVAVDVVHFFQAWDGGHEGIGDKAVDVDVSPLDPQLQVAS